MSSNIPPPSVKMTLWESWLEIGKPGPVPFAVYYNIAAMREHESIQSPA